MLGGSLHIPPPKNDTAPPGTPRWKTALYAALGAMALAAAIIWIPYWPVQALLGIGAAVFVYVMLHDPAYFFMRMTGLCLGAATGVGSLPAIKAGFGLPDGTWAAFILDSSPWAAGGLAIVGLGFGALELLHRRPPPAPPSSSPPPSSPSGPVTHNHGPINATTHQGPVNTGTVRNQTNNFGPTTTVTGDLIITYGISEATLNKILDALGPRAVTGPLIVGKNNFTESGVVWNRFFTGREADLARLHTALALKSQAISHALLGAGGVGKTELARAFALIFAGEYDGVWWIDASDAGFSDSISRVYKAVTGTPAAPDAKPEELAAHLARLWSAGTHLVVLDNLESASPLALFALTGGSRVLATTRTDLSSAATVQPFKVDVLSEEAATALLARQTEKCTPRHAEADLLTIARELGCHTLAVALAGSYLSRYADVSAAEYLKMVREHGTGEAEPREEGEEHDPLLLKYKHSVRACLSLHFAKFAGKKEMVLLGMASFCHSSGIPLVLLAAAMKVELGTVRALARNLADVSIVTYEGTVGVHRLTQGVVRSMLDAETRELMLDAVVGAMNPDFADALDHRNWPRQSVLAAHAAAAIEHAAREQATEAAGRLANQLGLYLGEAGRYADAKRSLERAIAIDEKHFAPDHPTFATGYSNLAGIQQDQGDLPGARASMERAIAIGEKHFAPDHPTLATSYSNLATIQKDQGDLPGARASMEQAIAIDERHFAPDHPTFAIRYSNLAMIQKAQGDLPGARASMERAIAIKVKHFAPDHPTFATSYSNLAAVQLAAGDLPGARASMERAIAIQSKHFAPDQPTFATSYSNLAMIQQAEGELNAARTSMERALAIEERHFAPDHPTIAVSYANIAGILAAQGKRDEAQNYLQRSLAILLKHFDEGHPHIRAVHRSIKNIAGGN